MYARCSRGIYVAVTGEILSRDTFNLGRNIKGRELSKVLLAALLPKPPDPLMKPRSRFIFHLECVFPLQPCFFAQFLATCILDAKGGEALDSNDASSCLSANQCADDCLARSREIHQLELRGCWQFTKLLEVLFWAVAVVLPCQQTQMALIAD